MRVQGRHSTADRPHARLLRVPTRTTTGNPPQGTLERGAGPLGRSPDGHPSPHRLKLVSSLLLCENISVKSDCSICPMAKQTRLPFPSSSKSTHVPFELIHCDIWGPHKVPTHLGARFFLTIVDDFTRCTWVFLMQHKSETQNLLKYFITFARTQFHASVKTIRVDNGAEFLSMQNFFHTHGIEYQHTCVYTPQQNGIVERKHHHLLNVA